VRTRPRDAVPPVLSARPSEIVIESTPYRVVAVDRNRIIDLHVLRGPPNVLDIVLKRKLRSMDADYHQSADTTGSTPSRTVFIGTAGILTAIPKVGTGLSNLSSDRFF
jgi:hypothetical protein